MSTTPSHPGIRTTHNLKADGMNGHGRVYRGAETLPLRKNDVLCGLVPRGSNLLRGPLIVRRSIGSRTVDESEPAAFGSRPPSLGPGARSRPSWTLIFPIDTPCTPMTRRVGEPENPKTERLTPLPRASRQRKPLGSSSNGPDSVAVHLRIDVYVAAHEAYMIRWSQVAGRRTRPVLSALNAKERVLRGKHGIRVA